MKYLVCTRGVPQRVRAGVWFTAASAEYDLTEEQLKAVQADSHLVAKPVAVKVAPPALASKK